jgi:hypothetical protein
MVDGLVEMIERMIGSSWYEMEKMGQGRVGVGRVEELEELGRECVIMDLRVSG